MNTTLEWLSANHEIVVSTATVVIAASAIVTAWLTHSLVKENRRLRKIGEEPKIVAYLNGDSENAAMINLELMNVGRGPAMKIAFEFQIEERFYTGNSYILSGDYDRKPFDFLPQDEKIIMFFSSGMHVLKKGDELQPFTVKVTWENMKGHEYMEEYILDVCQFRGIAIPTSSIERDIADSLKKISKRLDGFASRYQRLKVETITTEEEHRAIKNSSDD